MPLSLANMAVNIPLAVYSSGVNKFQVIREGNMIMAALVVWTVFCLFGLYFSLPQLLFSNVYFLNSISNNIKANFKNIGPILFSVLVVIFMSAVSALCLVLPFIFVVLPTISGINYVAYATIFEDLNLSEGVQFNEISKTDFKPV